MKNKIILILSIITLLYSSNLSRGAFTIVDAKHHLLWQDNKDTISLALTHKDAINYCKKLSLEGYSNWRLPTVDEYKYIFDLTREDEILLDKKFRFVIKDDYWTSDRTWYRNFGKYAYFIKIKSAHSYYQNRSYKKYVRCVKDI